MRDVFIGSEQLARGALSWGQLRWNYESMFPDVYAPKGTCLPLQTRVMGAWLWSGRDGIIAGRAAAALHGAAWVGPATPIELIGSFSRSPKGVIVRNERITGGDEIVEINGMAVTSLARTALDLARHLPRDEAVRHLDALAHATGVCPDDALTVAGRYPRARGLRRAEIAIDLMDAGGQSPKETWLRLLLIDAGFPRPRTQIRVSDGAASAFIDMGWDEPSIGVDYDGDQHRTDRRRYVHDIGRNELIERMGWLDLHVVAEHSRTFIVRRIAEAFARRGCPLKLRPRS
ncbi:MAG: hypothetical protein QOD90_6308 [Mycobacterium sp.]|jgi:hypothetical protein|nr:hypothetical protein [Mycobacterium sp.]